MHYELHPLIALAQAGRIKPEAVVSHCFALSQGPAAYELFADRSDGVRKILADVAAKTTRRTRAIVPVHLAGRTDGLLDLAAYAQSAGLHLVEDACQAQGSTTRGRAAGTVGSIGCFSLKDGKIISCGEGGATSSRTTTTSPPAPPRTARTGSPPPLVHRPPAGAG